MSRATGTIEVAIADVRVNGRYRKDIGDVSSLAASIERIGLMHAIVVRSDLTLIAGERRLEAVKSIGRDKIEARVVERFDDAVAALEAERDENTERKDLTPSEKVALGKALWELERPRAKQRQKDRKGNQPGSDKSENFTDLARGQTRDKVGSAIGMSGPTYQRAAAVVDAAEQEPEQYGDLVQAMDESGKVTPAYNELQRRKKEPKAARPTGKRENQTIEERALRVRSLAAQGHIAEQIADQLGVGIEYVRRIAGKFDITLPDKAMGQRRKINPNRIMSETVGTLEGLAMGVRLIDNVNDGFDADKLPVWVQSMSESLKTLNALHRRMKGIANGS